MTWFIQSTNLDLWDVIEDGPHIPSKLENGVMVPKLKHEWDELDRKKVQLNAKAVFILHCAIDRNEFNRIWHCKSAKEIWKLLEVTYEGNNQVKESKINILMHDYELFSIKDFESIVEMFSSLGKTYTEVEKVMKILKSLPKKWETKVTAIQEAKDLTKLSLEELIGSLMTYEIELYNHQRVEENEKSIAFMAITNDDEEEESESESDEGSMQKGGYAYLGKNVLTILVTVSLLKLNLQLVLFSYIERELFSNLGFVIIKKGEIVKPRQIKPRRNHEEEDHLKEKSFSRPKLLNISFVEPKKWLNRFNRSTGCARPIENRLSEAKKFLSPNGLLFPVKVEPQLVEVRLRPNGRFPQWLVNRSAPNSTGRTPNG
ncbi:hypothetical protein AAG906_037551 [Vitis piasezkii]